MPPNCVRGMIILMERSCSPSISPLTEKETGRNNPRVFKFTLHINRTNEAENRFSSSNVRERLIRVIVFLRQLVRSAFLAGTLTLETLIKD